VLFLSQCWGAPEDNGGAIFLDCNTEDRFIGKKNTLLYDLLVTSVLYCNTTPNITWAVTETKGQ
jgi:hypothetical protein